MSSRHYGFQITKNSVSWRKYCSALFKIMRLAFVSAFMVLAMLVYILFTFNHILLPNMLVVTENKTSVGSPLHLLLSTEQALQEELRESDCAALKRISDRSTLELKTLVLAETVVPYETKEKLADYVAQQLQGSPDVVTRAQTSAVMTMVTRIPAQGSVAKAEVGQQGSLRTSVVLALLKTHLNNVHFMMICALAEPRLGWRWITQSERNTWNNVLGRVLMNKVRADAGLHLLPRQQQLRSTCSKSSIDDGTLQGGGGGDHAADGEDDLEDVTLRFRGNNKLAFHHLLPKDF